MSSTNSLISLISILLFCNAAPAQDAKTPVEATAPWVMNSKTGKPIELETLVDELSGNELIVLGEQHDNDSGHEFQLNIIKSLVDKGVDVVVSMEQFERDVQGALDDYLAGRITEEQFVANSRPWKNYSKHYRPIIEFAKEKRLPVLAGNVPATVASSVSKGEPVAASQRVFLPRTTSAPNDYYWENFEVTMKGHIGNDGAAKLKHFYAAQCLKDDAMAETITDYLAANSHQPKTVVHLCGHFHSDYGLGTVARVVQRKPLIRVAVFTMATVSVSDSQKAKSDLATRDRAHYIFWTVKNQVQPEAADK